MGSLDSAQLVAHSEVFFKLISRRLPVPLWGIRSSSTGRGFTNRVTRRNQPSSLAASTTTAEPRAARVLRRHCGLVLRPRGRDRHEPQSPGND